MKDIHMGFGIWHDANGLWANYLLHQYVGGWEWVCWYPLKVHKYIT